MLQWIVLHNQVWSKSYRYTKVDYTSSTKLKCDYFSICNQNKRINHLLKMEPCSELKTACNRSDCSRWASSLEVTLCRKLTAFRGFMLVDGKPVSILSTRTAKTWKGKMIVNIQSSMALIEIFPNLVPQAIGWATGWKRNGTTPSIKCHSSGRLTI